MTATEVADLAGYDTATFSDDRAYRYTLTRTWQPGQRTAVWMMLNPSTADAFQVDPTIRRCIDFSARHGCGALLVLNLFALRATNPADMLRHADPVGPSNDDAIRAAADQHADGLWIAGWGAHGHHLARDRAVQALLADAGIQLHHLGLTQAGQPRHPLYVPGAAPLAVLPTRED